ncbi:PH domain-containing protein [Aldersonia sp. NBC_00410]|uniref:PH domain-containing protein n=1 Tax=Aldersonia sp. NBC_00410 TaxID=2975954 RepID=UPI0022598C6E|nr:PH domain-containing protein [Aldersonia sp. NBC_00410]MCX5043786.1 PH domain-containing protein [Aldersonia sp. NBC_00410]
MLLVHPVHEAVRLAPALLAAVLLGSRSDNHVWGLLGLAVVVGLAIARWFTTTYRIGPVHIELRTGLFQRKLLSVPRSRIRSVDVESTLLHRALGLAVVHVGTGRQERKDTGFRLNALDARGVPQLRAALLRTAPAETAPDEAPVRPAPPVGIEIAHFSPGWVRYAPLSLTGLAIVAPVAGLLAQYGAVEWVAESGAVTGGVHAAERLGVLVAVVIGIALLLALTSAAACASYLLRWGGLRVVDDGATLHCESGVLTTRAVTLDRNRLRGATVAEPLLLRAVGGGEVEAIMTGSRRQQKVLPQSPRGEVDRVMNHLLGSAAQYSVGLRTHGPAAARRRVTRAVLPVLLGALGLAIAQLAGAPIPWPAWLAVAVLATAALALAWDRYRGLGHAVLETEPNWLITRSGSLDRERHCIEADGIVGWTVRQSFFQRRAGLATVSAATAAGAGRYDVADLPAGQAWDLVEQAQPGAGDRWAVHSARTMVE